MIFLNVKGISKKAETGFTLNDISFVQHRLQKIAIAGETGSGKSTLLRIIAGLIQPDIGGVRLKEERVAGPEEKLIPGHRAVAYLSQHFELRNNYLVEEVLIMENKMTDEEASAIYNVCRIGHLLKRRTEQLSGGEKQRIAIAKLLVSSPQLLLLDEPYSNLDIIHKAILKSVIRDIGEKLEITCILISHDALDTLSWADEILVMKAGEIIQKGSPEEIYYSPATEYAAALFGTCNLISPVLAHAFNPSGPFDLNENKVLVRPEHFEIATEGTHALLGEVNNVRFFGGYYEIDVFLFNSMITIKTGITNLTKGDKLRVSMNATKICYV